MFSEKELDLLKEYEKEFNETPPVAFLDPETSEKLMREAIKNGKPFDEKDLKRMDEEELIIPMMKKIQKENSRTSDNNDLPL